MIDTLYSLYTIDDTHCTSAAFASETKTKRTRFFLLNTQLPQPPSPEREGLRPLLGHPTAHRHATPRAPTRPYGAREASAGLGSSRAAIRPACGTRHECSVKSTTEKRVRAPA